MDNNKEYFAFISYKREDEKWAIWLQNKIEHYKLPSNLNGRTDLPKEIRPIFRDKSELAGGVLADEIRSALENSKYLIVICSPRAAQSQWVGKEVQSFIDMGRTDKIIPFIIGGTAHAQNPEEECFPAALLNLPLEQELLGINIDEMGRDAAAVKVVSQMFGLKFDALWQRYERENRRRRVFIIVAALLMALIGVGVTVALSRQNKKINEQNERITTQRDEIKKQNEDILKKNDRLQADSVVMAAQLDSINMRDELIKRQKDSIEQTNQSLIVERDNLKRAYWNIMENQARFVAEKVNTLVENGDSYTAQRLLVDVMPQNLLLPDRPCTVETEDALRNACCYNTAILLKKSEFQPNYSVAFSPNGKRMVSCSLFTVSVWDTESGIETRNWEICDWGRYMGTNQAFFYPDNKRVITLSGEDNVARVWDIESDREILVFDPNAEVLALSPDGKSIVTVSWDNIVEIWDATSGSKIKSLGKCCDNLYDDPEVNAAMFNPNGRHIAFALYDGTTRVWDLELGREILVLQGHKGEVNSVSYSLDGSCLVTSSSDKSVRIWDAESGDVINILEGHTDEVNSAAFSPDGELIVTASTDGTVRIWDAVCGTEVCVLRGHTSGVTSAAFSPDGKLIASSSYDLTIRLWGVKKAVKTLNHNTRVQYADFSPDGKLIVTASDDLSVRIWDVESGVKVQCLGQWSDDVYYDYYDYSSPKVKAVDFSPNGKLVLIASDESVRLWDLKLGQMVHSFEGFAGCESAIFSSDGKNVISAHGDSFLTWDIESGEMIHLFETEDSYFKTFSSDRKRVVTVSSENTVEIWDIELERRTHTFVGNDSSISFAAFSLDGKYIVSASDNQSLVFWEVESGREIRVIRDIGGVEAISPDFKYVAFLDGSEGYTIQVLDVESGKRSTLKGHINSVTSVAFSPDGKTIISVAREKSVRVWGHPLFMSLQDLIDQTRERFKDRPLTPEERRQYYLE